VRAVVQRVAECSITVEACKIAQMKKGILVYLGIAAGDTEKDLAYIADKVVNLRIFPDDQGKMNLSLKDTGFGITVVSQFTLYGDTRKGRRPSYDLAAPPEKALEFYEKFLVLVENMGFCPETGRFQAHMDVSYVNEGPVTILVDSEKTF
jgi:D-tyrosyl-tRNA(Tyr) deacylase